MIKYIDAASKTTEGIKTMVTSTDNNKPNEIRHQFPRVFYGQYILQTLIILLIDLIFK